MASIPLNNNYRNHTSHCPGFRNVGVPVWTQRLGFHIDRLKEAQASNSETVFQVGEADFVDWQRGKWKFLGLWEEDLDFGLMGLNRRGAGGSLSCLWPMLEDKIY